MRQKMTTTQDGTKMRKFSSIMGQTRSGIASAHDVLYPRYLSWVMVMLMRKRMTMTLVVSLNESGSKSE
jgi:hypothetical protein